MTYQRRNTRGTKFVFDPSFLMQAIPFVTNYLSSWTQNKLSGVSGNKSDILKQVSYVLDFLHAAVDSGEFDREAKEAEQKLEKLYDEVMKYVDRDGNLPDDIVNDKAFDKIVDVAADTISALDGVQEFTLDKMDDLKHIFSSDKGFYMKSIDPYSYVGQNAGCDLINDWIQDTQSGFEYVFEPADFKGTSSQTDELLDMLTSNISSADLEELYGIFVDVAADLHASGDSVSYRSVDNVGKFVSSAIVYQDRFY